MGPGVPVFADLGEHCELDEAGKTHEDPPGRRVASRGGRNRGHGDRLLAEGPGGRPRRAEFPATTTSPPRLINMPDGFSNVSAKCDGPNMVYVVYHSDSAYGSVAIAPNDPRCRDGRLTHRGPVGLRVRHTPWLEEPRIRGHRVCLARDLRS